MMKCSTKRWCFGLTAMLEHLHPRKRPALALATIVVSEIDGTRVGNYFEVQYPRKKLTPLVFAYCPFCGMQFKKLIHPPTTPAKR